MIISLSFTIIIDPYQQATASSKQKSQPRIDWFRSIGDDNTQLEIR